MQFQKASAERKRQEARARNPSAYDRLTNALHPWLTFGECWLLQRYVSKDGYGYIRIAGRKSKAKAHRVMFGLFFPGEEPTVVRHTCNRPSCVNPAHLRAGTQKDNAEDRKASGREGDHKGLKNGRAKLTPELVRFIRSTTESGCSLAKRLGVTNAQISAVRHRKAWSHID